MTAVQFTRLIKTFNCKVEELHKKFSYYETEYWLLIDGSYIVNKVDTMMIKIFGGTQIWQYPKSKGISIFSPGINDDHVIYTEGDFSSVLCLLHYYNILR